MKLIIRSLDYNKKSEILKEFRHALGQVGKKWSFHTNRDSLLINIFPSLDNSLPSVLSYLQLKFNNIEILETGIYEI